MKKINLIILSFLATLALVLVGTNIPEKSIKETHLQVEEKAYKTGQTLGLIISVEDQEFAGTLHFLFEELNEEEIILGYKYPYEQGITTSEDIWTYVAKNVKSDYLVFDESFFCNIERQGQESMDKLLENDQVDLFLTLGTKAGQLAIKASNSVDTLNILSEDAVQSGITAYKAYGDQKNFWVLIDNNKHLKKLNIFYSLIDFKKLGVIRYPDSFRRSFTPEATLEAFGKDKGIEIVYYDIEGVDDLFNEGQFDLYYDQVRAAHKALSEECDAFYMIVGGWNPKDLLALLQPFYDKKIPVVSAVGHVDVVNGALLGVGKSDFEEIGDLTATNIIKILSGTQPNELMQIYDEKQAISYNVAIGKQIDFKPNINFILYCDEFVGDAYEE